MDEKNPIYKAVAALLIALLAAGVLSYGYTFFFAADEVGAEVQEPVD